MNKYYIDVKTVKYSDDEIPTVVTIDKKAYIISEIKTVNHKAVFQKGGTGSEWIVVIGSKETTLCYDKHNMRWNVYRNVSNEKELMERIGERVSAETMMKYK